MRIKYAETLKGSMFFLRSTQSLQKVFLSALALHNTESCNVLFVELESQFEPSTFSFSVHHAYSSIDDININIQYSFASCSEISEISEISAFSNMPYVYSKTRNSRISQKSWNELFFSRRTFCLGCFITMQ